MQKLIWLFLKIVAVVIEVIFLLSASFFPWTGMFRLALLPPINRLQLCPDSLSITWCVSHDASYDQWDATGSANWALFTSLQIFCKSDVHTAKFVSVLKSSHNMPPLFPLLPMCTRTSAVNLESRISKSLKLLFEYELFFPDKLIRITMKTVLLTWEKKLS